MYQVNVKQQFEQLAETLDQEANAMVQERLSGNENAQRDAER